MHPIFSGRAMQMRGSDGALVEFRFVSRLAEGLPEAVLLRLERQSGQFNRLYGLTGEMHLDRGVIRQVVEGSWQVVMPLAARILTDHRHGAISIAAFQPIRARRFQEWASSGFGPGRVASLLASARESNLRLLPSIAWQPLPERTARIGTP
jgi:hypothetical protein